jgi:Ran GTPase-activating protein 1
MFTGRLRSEIPLSLGHLVRALEDKQHLHTIDFGDNAFGPDGLRPLAPLIGQRTSLQVIRLNNTGLGPHGGQLLAQALMEAHKKNVADGAESNLRVLVVGRSRLENGSMAAIAEALESHGHLNEICFPQVCAYLFI